MIPDLFSFRGHIWASAMVKVVVLFFKKKRKESDSNETDGPLLSVSPERQL